MRITKERIIFFLLHLIFSAIIPITLVVVQYSNIGNTDGAVGFKVSITGIMLLLFLFWTVKRLFIDRKLTDMQTQCNVMLADLKTKQNEAEIKALEKEIRFIKTVEAILNSIVPLLFLIAAIIAFRALEAQLIKLSSTLGCITVSYAVGIVFNICYSRQIHSKQSKKGGVNNG